MPIQNLLGVPIVILSQIDVIDIDLVEQVTVQHESLVTQNPTETGRNITDHIVNLPVVISMTGRFVDTPFPTGLTSFIPGSGFLAAVSSGLAGGLSLQQWNALENLRAARATFDVVIQQGVYPDMAIRSLSAPRAKGDGTSQRFQVEMIQVVTTAVNEIATFAAVSGGSTSNVDSSVAHTAPKSVVTGAKASIVWTGSIA